MKLVFLGSGSAFTIGDDNFQSNMLLIDDDNANLLIDCGTDARLSLYQLGYTDADINDVYISHLHADHAGGLEWLGFSRMFSSDSPRPRLHITEQLVYDLWHKSLCGGMLSLADRVAQLSDYFDVRSIDNVNEFQWSSVKFQLVQTYHINSGGVIQPSFGLFFTINNQSIFITTDTQFTPEHLMPWYKKADIIFHECQIADNPDTVHSCYKNLLGLDANIRAKMWLYHYQPVQLPDAKKDGFLGFVLRGQEFLF